MREVSHPRSTADQAVREDLAIMQLAPEQRETIRREVSWGATPLVFSGYKEIAENQNEVYGILLDRITEGAPENIPAVLRQFIEVSFMHRFHQRMMRNQASFNERLFAFDAREPGSEDMTLESDRFEYEFDLALDGLEAYEAELATYDAVFDTQPELHEVYERVLRGTGSVRDTLLVREAFGMRSIELARLTHPYGQMIEELDGMRAEVSESIVSLGGELFDEPVTTYKVINTDMISDPEQDHIQIGVLVTRKRHIGRMPDGTEIYERSSFVLRIDEASGFDQELARAMRQVKRHDDEDGNEWNKRIKLAGRLEEILPKLLEANNFECILPMSTTVYAYNRLDNEAIEERKKMVKKQREDLFSERHPGIRELQQRQRQQQLGGQAIRGTSHRGI